MSIFDTLNDQGLTQEDLEKAASARLFAEAAAAEGIDLSELTEAQAEELYDFWANNEVEAEKAASANAFFEAAAAEGIDLNELTEDQVGELYEFWANGGEEKVASAEDLLAEAAVKEASAKLAEAEYIGRYMARVYADELDKVADWKETAGNAARRVGGAFKADRLREAMGDWKTYKSGLQQHHAMHGNINEAFKAPSVRERMALQGGELAKGLGETGAAYGTAGLGAYGAYKGGKKLLGKKSEEGEKKSSIDELIEERALEMLVELEAEKVAGDYIGGMAEKGRAKEKMHAAKKSLMLAHSEREELLRKGHEGMASGIRKKRLGSTILGGALGGVQGAGVAALRGGGKLKMLGGAALGGAVGGGATNLASRLSEKVHSERASDPHALRAELASKVNKSGRLKKEHKAIADLVAAREGRGSGGGLLNVSLNRGGQSSGIRRESGTGEKRSSVDDLIEARALEMLEEVETAAAIDEAALELLAENGFLE